MTDESGTLRTILKNDQAITELNDTVGRVVTAYKMMVTNGIPEADAAAMARVYNQRVMNRHFGVQMIAMADAYLEDGE